MKKLISLTLALLFCFAISLSAFADVWIPPIDDEYYCQALKELAHSKGGAEVLNRYASEYLQAGLKTFDESTADEEIAAVVVRMILQHPKQYEGVMSDPSGVTGISAEAFAACAETRFGRTLRAEDFFECMNGSFLVSESTTAAYETPSNAAYAQSGKFGDYADDAAHPRNVFAYAEDSYYMGDGIYQFSFRIYETTSDPETCYALNDPRTAENALCVGYCYIALKYSGDVEATQFDASGFSLLHFLNDRLSEEELAFLNEEEPQEVSELETEATPTFETVTEHGTPIDEATVDEAPKESGFWTIGTIITVIAVAVAALGAGAAILLLKKKKR